MPGPACRPGRPGWFHCRMINDAHQGQSPPEFRQGQPPAVAGQAHLQCAAGQLRERDRRGFLRRGPLSGERRNGTLFVADAGVLTAFDAHTGNARWRVPTIGITGMFFDDAGMIYVNSTTANLDKLRYSRQIDIAQKIDPVVMRRSVTGQRPDLVEREARRLHHLRLRPVHLSGDDPHYAGDFNENGDSKFGFDTGLEKSAYVKVKRLNPKNGAELWEYDDGRCPVDAQFNRNVIQLAAFPHGSVRRSNS